MPRRLTDPLLRETPTVRVDAPVADALQLMAQADLPAVPVVDDTDSFVGIFGEREFIGALFPRYLGSLSSAAYVTKSLDAAIDKRAGCVREPVDAYVNREHIDVGTDHSDAEIAEIFLHHRVLLVPVLDGRRVAGVITRRDFTRALADRALG